MNCLDENELLIEENRILKNLLREKLSFEEIIDLRLREGIDLNDIYETL